MKVSEQITKDLQAVIDTARTAAVSLITPVYNVAGYGATGDGVTDDTEAIQSAVDAADAADGTVYFPKGTYKATNFTRPSGVRQVGCEASLSIGGVTVPIPSLDDSSTGNVTLYVDPTGSDTDNHGFSADYPFQTIQKAVDSLPHTIKHHVTIQLADGTYTDTTTTTTGAHIDTYSTEATVVCAVFKALDIREGASILLLGNVSTPASVVIDGGSTADTGVFIFNTKRVNLKGITVQGCTFAPVQYKRYSSGQLKNMRLSGGQFGLLSYQFCFVEVQGDTQITAATAYGMGLYGHHYGAMSGLTMTANAKGILVTDGSAVSLAGGSGAITLANTGADITVERSGYVAGQNVTLATADVYGRLFLYTSTITGNQGRGLVEVYDGGYAELNGNTFSSGVASASAAGFALRVKEHARAYLVGGTIANFYHGIAALDGSSLRVDSCRINESLYDGISGQGCALTIKSVTSTVNNGRNGVRLTAKCTLRDLGGNTVTGASGATFSANSIFPAESGTTASRPTTYLETGRPYFDTTLGKPIWYKTGTGWVDATGATV